MQLPRSIINSMLLIVFALFVLGYTASANTPEEQESALEDYYRICTGRLADPEVLVMCDTLAMRANLAENGHFIILAAMTRLNYYYFQNDRKKIEELVGEVKRLSKKHDELKYYYFAWGSRLITFYLKNGMSNHALLEAQQMLREAQTDNFPKGMIECYKAMGNIYMVQSSHKLAAEYFQKLVEQVEEHTPDDVNIPVYYSALSDSELNSGQPDKAAKALDCIEAYFAKTDTITPYQQLTLARSRIEICQRKNDTDGIRRAYKQIEHLFAQYPNELAIHEKILFLARLTYFKDTEQNDKALATIDSILRKVPTAEMSTFLLLKKGDIHRLKNDWVAAARCYLDYITLTDSVRQASTQKSANEIAGILSLQQLEKENKQLEVDIQDRRLKTTYWALGLLGIVLFTGAVILIRMFRMNIQLKEAERQLHSQNRELQQAKEQAEEASQMKSRFIQDISHEVRTPLNLIVGFSQVVSDLCDTPETQEYTSIIVQNSGSLLRLFNDVLELSNLDQTQKLSYDTLANVNDCCREALDQIRSLVKEGVEVTFDSSEAELQIYTNPTYVTRMLDCLLHNAAKFTESGRISLACQVLRAECVVCYSVTDTGIGIPASEHELIFERFKKVDTFTQGSGLGLPVCNTIAKKLGGTLELDKTHTRGCRFLLTLPLHLPTEAAA